MHEFRRRSCPRAALAPRPTAGLALHGSIRRKLIFRCPFERVDIIETGKPGFQTAKRLLKAFVDIAANRHHFAHGFHRGVQQWLGTFELFKGKARNFGDDIINRRFERRWRCAGNVVGDFVKREANRQLRRDLGNREPSGFRCKRRRTRYARVHFNNDQAAILRIDCELYVGTTCFYADFRKQAMLALRMI